MPRQSSRRVLGYARVSSAEQARGSSLADQQASVTAYAKGRGLAVSKFYVEAVSAVREKIESREQIQALMRDVKRGDLVVVDKLDRWSRDAEFSYRSIRELLAAGASFFSVAERLDPSTSEGDTALGFRILFAREEHKRIRERMVGTRQTLRDHGYYSEGLPPFGYRRAHPKGYKGAEKNVLIINEEEAELVREVFKLTAAGRSIARVVEQTGVSRDRVAQIIHSRIFVGEIQNSAGAWIVGKHPAIVSADLYVRAQDAIEGRRLGGPRPRGAPAETDDWILRDVAACGLCGARMSAAYAGPHEARRYYYRCAHKCTTRFVPVRLVELAAEPLIVTRLAELRDALAREPTHAPKRLRPVVPVDVKRARLEGQRERAADAYVTGSMPRERMLATVAKIDAELLRLAAVTAPDPLADIAVRREVLREMATLERAWRGGAPRVRRAIVGQLAVSVALEADEAPLPTWRSLEDLAVKNA